MDIKFKMRILLTVFFVLVTELTLFAQKQIIDTGAYSQWPQLGSIVLGRDGKYAVYHIQNMPRGRTTSVVQSTDGKWKKEFTGEPKNYSIAGGGQLLVYRHGRETLAFLKLGSDRCGYLSNVASYQLLKKEEILSYRLASQPQTLVLKNLRTNRERSYSNIEKEVYSEDKSTLIICQVQRNDGNHKSLTWVDLSNDRSVKIWKGTKIEDLVIDSRHQQLIFTSGDSLFYYRSGMEKADCLLPSIANAVERGFNFSAVTGFTKDGKRVLISLKQKELPKDQANAIQVWNYRDVKLPSEADYWSTDYAASFDPERNKIVRFQEKIDDQIFFPQGSDVADTLVLLVNEQRIKEPWSIAGKTENSLVSLKSGKQIRLPFLDNNRTVRFSPSGKFLIYFDQKGQNYYSYEIGTAKIRNLTQGLHVSWKDLYRNDLPEISAGPRGIATWLENDEAVLVYDSNDLWKLDPLGKQPSVNVTSGYGRRNQIIFSVALDTKEIKNCDKLYLSAFGTENKNNGFYSVRLNHRTDPEELCMGPYIYNTNSGYVVYNTDFSPIKAENTEMYVVRKMSATEFPNYFSTKDFRTFVRLTNFQPQRNYNWYTTELHTWRSLDGRLLKGILYKPENFNSSKKYPVIFHYYERKSDGLNAFIAPEALCGGGNINIPTYLSQGYLVFVPDIYYQVGDPMQGTYDAVVSAAKYIAELPFVNSSKMGIQGCSFGGIQTDYLVTNTNFFAAACSVVGYADWPSVYGALIDNQSSEQDLFENGSSRMGFSLWENPGQYLKNSGLLNVHKVTTPLLMMNNRLDGIIPFYDATAFFTGLRRMGKKAWLLSYAQGGHGVYGKDADDFSIRMMQFFDHYLKDKPAPIWMTRGTSALADDSGLAYDTEIKTPGPGLLKPAEQAKVDSLLNRKPITVTLK